MSEPSLFERLLSICKRIPDDRDFIDFKMHPVRDVTFIRALLPTT